GPHESVAISLTTQGLPPYLYPTAQTDNAGAFSITDTVPAVPYGQHTVSALGSKSGLTAKAPISVETLLFLYPQSGHVGDTVTFSGYGFASQEHIALPWGARTGPLLPTFPLNPASDGFGTLGSAQFTVPQSTPVTPKVYVEGQTSGWHAVSFAVLPSSDA